MPNTVTIRKFLKLSLHESRFKPVVDLRIFFWHIKTSFIADDEPQKQIP